MEIELSACKTGKVIYSNVYASDSKTDTDIQKNEWYTDQADYHISFSEKWFEGVHLSSISISTAAAEVFRLQNGGQQISYMFCLDGDVNFQYTDHSMRSFDGNGNGANNSAEYAQLSLEVVKNAELIYLQFTPEYHRKITNQECRGCFFSFSGEQIPIELNALLQQTRSYTYTGRAERIYLEAKIMELLLFFAEAKDIQVIGIKEDDVKKILLDRKIVEDNLQKPFSLIELSRKAGINDFKLKKGFKALTGFTVFGYLYKLRMEKAHFYLQKERRQVNEVSFLVGYKNPQHFIAAFKRHFNLLPGSLNKS